MKSSSRKSALTSDGKTVYLDDNGTWQYADESKIDTSTISFRKTNWGMTKEQVKQSEELHVIEERSDILYYQTIISGLQTFLYYIFVHDRLVRSKYVFNETHSNNNAYIMDFENLKEALIKKYLQPKEDRKIWQDDLYKDEPDDWGSAIGRGDLSLYSLWSFGDTDIFLGLSGDNFEFNLVIEYSSKSLAHLEELKRNQQALENL